MYIFIMYIQSILQYYIAIWFVVGWLQLNNGEAKVSCAAHCLHNCHYFLVPPVYKRAKAKSTVEASMQECQRTVPSATFNQAGNASSQPVLPH
jgi:hypothetical protein